jgi:Domain of unknown function (DUF5658)
VSDNTGVGRDVPSRKRPGIGWAWHLVFTKPLPLEHETSLFIFVSALDLFATYVLLRSGGFCESNALAQFFLAHGGLHGLIAFKFTLVALITVAAQVIAHRRLGTARLILNGGTLLVGAVVGYSLAMFGTYAFT